MLVTNAFGKTTYFYCSGGSQGWSGEPSRLFHAFSGKLQAAQNLGPCGESKSYLSGEKREPGKLNALRAVGKGGLKVALPTGLAPGHFLKWLKGEQSISSTTGWAGPQGGLTVPVVPQGATLPA